MKKPVEDSGVTKDWLKKVCSFSGIAKRVQDKDLRIRAMIRATMHKAFERQKEQMRKHRERAIRKQAELQKWNLVWDRKKVQRPEKST